MAPFLFQFVHASDPHWGAQSDPKFQLAGARATCFVNDLGKLIPRPEFILLTGDLASDGNGRPEEFDYANAEFAKLGLTTWVVPGNHDLSPGPRREKPGSVLKPLLETNWHRVYGDEGLFWVRHQGPIEFIGFALRNGDPDGILPRLQAHLETEPLPSHPWRILAGHYPIYPVRTGGTLSHWGMQHIEDCIKPLQELIQRYSQHVVAYFFGHTHALSAQIISDVLFASGGAIAVGAPGFRLLSVYPTHITSKFIPLSDPTLATFDFWGMGRRSAATDNMHETSDSYHRGLSIEQNFVFDFQTRELKDYTSTKVG